MEIHRQYFDYVAAVFVHMHTADNTLQRNLQGVTSRVFILQTPNQVNFSICITIFLLTECDVQTVLLTH